MPEQTADLAHLADIHAACFTTPRPWSAAEIAGMLALPHVFLHTSPGTPTPGFLIGSLVAGEAELLTLAVSPEARRQGLARALMAEFLDHLRKADATRIFLEVSAENPAAITLYESQGFAQSGRRRGYYHSPTGHRVDALVMTRTL